MLLSSLDLDPNLTVRLMKQNMESGAGLFQQFLLQHSVLPVFVIVF